MEKQPHPSKDIISSDGDTLSGRIIVLGITGSVAAVRSPDIARLLMRHGAEVFSVMSKAAIQIINPELLFWATGNKPVTKLTGAIEHVALCGNVENKADLLLIAPSTANTIGKITCGIDDTPVTTCATTAIGEGIPVLIVPAMHESMYKHPVVLKNIERCKSYGIHIMLPRMEEGKAKIPETGEIYDCIVQILLKKRIFKEKKILINAGRTVEYIDPVRVLTNNSTGKMGMAVAEKAVQMGGDVTVVYGKGTARRPSGCRIIDVETAVQMNEAIMKELKKKKYDLVILSAAIADFRPKEKSNEKISTHTHSELTLTLVPNPKILDTVKKVSPGSFIVAFRALYHLAQVELIDNAYTRMLKADADLIAVNDVSKADTGFESDTNELFVVNRKKEVKQIPLASKQEVAARLLEIVAEEMGIIKDPS
ncbi:MAG: bifunctional phosphopantothenoylcysteine decarboxylase/phosphopantothenate--cysteine ligase CoaBC [Spirochaetales bacterium]|nr:bifunctional phosphopantothenoylcysteine decarboxylase/phosphopantothenate--cysteine ligase CoaBC [Spirochaetales bacterium]